MASNGVVSRDPGQTNRSRRATSWVSSLSGRAGKATVILGLAALAVSVTPAIASTAQRTAAKGASFTFRGALTGTLEVTAANCTAGSYGASLYSSGKLKGVKTTTGWTIQVTSTKDGTFKLHQGKPPDVNVSSTSLHEWGFNANGTVTVDGSKGSVNTYLSSTNAPKIHISGSWNCPSQP
jgi:hypothetical protein